MILSFIKFPTTVTTDILFDQKKFPAVTLCNLNPYKADGQSAFSKEVAQFMAYYESVINDITAVPDTYGMLNQATTFDRDSRARDALMLLAAKYSWSDRESAMYDLDEVIADCTFGGRACDKSAWTSINHAVFGRCFTFNNEENRTSFAVTRAGKEFGLRLLVTARQSMPNSSSPAYLPTTFTAGAKVSIHAPGDLPNLEGTALSVGVGYTTDVAMTMSEYLLAKKPYGNCIERESADRNYYKDFKYSLLTCFNGCRQRETQRRCGCLTPRYNAPEGSVFCPPTKEKIDCLDSLKGDQANSAQRNLNPLMECGCGPACKETYYALTTSLSQFPPQNYTVVADVTASTSAKSLGSCTADNTNFADPSVCQDWYAENALQLQIYFETMRSERYTQVPSYGISAVLNDLGGQAGLYLGLSIVSVIEVIGLLAMLCRFTCNGCRIRVGPNSDELERDERMQDIRAFEKELDQAEKATADKVAAAKREAALPGPLPPSHNPFDAKQDSASAAVPVAAAATAAAAGGAVAAAAAASSPSPLSSDISDDEGSLPPPAGGSGGRAPETDSEPVSDTDEEDKPPVAKKK